MNDVIAWMAAGADLPEQQRKALLKPKAGLNGAPDADELKSRRRRREEDLREEKLLAQSLPTHQFPSNPLLANAARSGAPIADTEPEDLSPAVFENLEEERRRRIYRGRAIGMLRRYMRYAIESGRLPSVLGKEFFRAKVTAYTVVTFEDRVIFVHDMENCLERLDEFSRQLIARHIMQEHDQAATARLLGCTERTVRRLVPLALDQISEILLDRGMMKRLDDDGQNSCQGGPEHEIFVSDCEDSENKF